MRIAFAAAAAGAHLHRYRYTALQTETLDRKTERFESHTLPILDALAAARIGALRIGQVGRIRSTRETTFVCPEWTGAL